MPPETVRRGQRLAERQRAHLFELELTGRWRRYFRTEDELQAKIAAASESVARWTQLNEMLEKSAATTQAEPVREPEQVEEA